MDFKPWHNGWYSEGFNEAVTFLQSCGQLGSRLIKMPDRKEILYFMNLDALTDLANPKSSFWYANEKLVPIETREKVKLIVKEYYQHKFSQVAK